MRRSHSQTWTHLAKVGTPPTKRSARDEVVLGAPADADADDDADAKSKSKSAPSPSPSPSPSPRLSFLPATPATPPPRNNGGGGGGGGKNGRHSKKAKAILHEWLWDHFYPTAERRKPVPTREEKRELAAKTGLTPQQVGDWFVNARARLWKPYIEGLVRGVCDEMQTQPEGEAAAPAAAAAAAAAGGGSCEGGFGAMLRGSLE